MNTSIRYTLLFALAIFFFSFKPAPADYAATMEGWEVDLTKAMELSKESGKPIMANFTGSDWCGWCIRLKNEVFTKKEFQDWAKEEVILLELDFPRRMKIPEKYQLQNRQLATSFGVSGYPTIWVFEAEPGDDDKPHLTGLAKSGYVKGGPTAWINNMKAMLAPKE